jgi:3-hydroxyacyl-CoA dehydrogenase/3-hydroxy-2-methylbutyryl-CoA dehydrogenase
MFYSFCSLFGFRASFITQVTSEEDVTRAIDSIKDKFGKLNIVVNCAGIGVAFKTYNFNKKLPHKFGDFSRVLNVMAGIKYLPHPSIPD